MDAKDLRTEAALGDRNDGNTKYSQGGSSLPCHRSKAYQDIASNSLGKVDAASTRPCAVIGPDRVVLPPASTDAYLKKGPNEPWLGSDSTYRRPPEYPHKLIDYQHPTRNISPRQTFQENMQRIMVPPSYATVKLKEDHNFPGDPNVTQLRNNKLSVPMDPGSKYCDVPYNINSVINEQKNIRNSDISVTNMNNVLTRSAPHRWPTSSANVRATKTYPQELCQYTEYPSCAGPRPMVMPRPNRSVHDEAGPIYPEAYYHEGNIRFKPYPTVKERYPQTRYEYISNYPNPFHPPPPFPSHKYDIQKPLPPHPYPGYSQVPFKYLDGRMAEPIMNGYQRSLNPQANYNNIAYRNQMIHPSYGALPGNCIQTNKFYPYPPEASKPLPPNKLPYTDANGKIYSEYDSNRPKNFHMPEGFYVNEITRTHPMKGQSLPHNYPANIHAIPPHPYYRKDTVKGFEYSPNPHFRGIDPTLNINGNLLSRFPAQFSPSAIAISPSDSNTSNDTNQTQGTPQEDFGYVSQSSNASIRSIDSGVNRIPPEFRRYDPRYTPIIKSTVTSKQEQSSNNARDKKDIDVRQFLQMWNEGEEESGENNAKEIVIKTVPNNYNESANNFETSSQEQLYVLGLVNVPSEELAKYEHIQKVSKLPENIKGYNNIELLHQFEEIIESSNLSYGGKTATIKDFHNPLKSTMPVHGISIPSRPLSPLDVEAKISQSVIHKEVGCNFEIKPCSPKMLNVEIATPIQSVLGERIIEKVSNPLIGQSPILQSSNEKRGDCNVVLDGQDQTVSRENSKVASCKMVNPQYNNNETIDVVKTNYSIQDLESNSGVCLASLPRLDNDIELNFPEVNQQFINANKVESVITPTSIKDLPPLDADPCQTAEPKLESRTNNSTANNPVEKDFSKLSKYRKLKRKGSETNSSETNVQALRTDSVIIKNPENFKTHEGTSDKSPRSNLIEAQCDPINLSVTTECREIDAARECYDMQSVDNELDEKAIDFSTNTNESNDESSKNNSISAKEQGSALENNQRNISEISNTFQEDETIRSILESNSENTKLTNNSNSAVVNFSCDKEHHQIDFPKKRKKQSTNVLSKPIDTSDNFLSEAISYDKLEESKQSLKSQEKTNKHQTPEYSLSETEDSINMKMRELFGELSVPESDSNLNVSQNNLEDEVLASIDDVVANKMYALHKELDLDPTKSEKNLNVIEQSNQDDSKTQGLCHEKKQVSIETNTLIDSKCSKKSIFDIDEQHYLEVNKTQKILHTNEKNVDNCQSDSYLSYFNQVPCDIHVNKELLSPWIQKLILYNEGFCGITKPNLFVNDLNINGSYSHSSESTNNDHVKETSNNTRGLATKLVPNEKFLDPISEIPITQNVKTDINVTSSVEIPLTNTYFNETVEDSAIEICSNENKEKCENSKQIHIDIEECKENIAGSSEDKESSKDNDSNEKEIPKTGVTFTPIVDCLRNVKKNEATPSESIHNTLPEKAEISTTNDKPYLNMDDDSNEVFKVTQKSIFNVVSTITVANSYSNIYSEDNKPILTNLESLEKKVEINLTQGSENSLTKVQCHESELKENVLSNEKKVTANAPIETVYCTDTIVIHDVEENLADKITINDPSQSHSTVDNSLEYNKTYSTADTIKNNNKSVDEVLDKIHSNRNCKETIDVILEGNKKNNTYTYQNIKNLVDDNEVDNVVNSTQSKTSINEISDEMETCNIRYPTEKDKNSIEETINETEAVRPSLTDSIQIHSEADRNADITRNCKIPRDGIFDKNKTIYNVDNIKNDRILADPVRVVSETDINVDLTQNCRIPTEENLDKLKTVSNVDTIQNNKSSFDENIKNTNSDTSQTDTTCTNGSFNEIKSKSNADVIHDEKSCNEVILNKNVSCSDADSISRHFHNTDEMKNEIDTNHNIDIDNTQEKDVDQVIRAKNTPDNLNVADADNEHKEYDTYSINYNETKRSNLVTEFPSKQNTVTYVSKNEIAVCSANNIEMKCKSIDLVNSSDEKVSIENKLMSLTEDNIGSDNIDEDSVFELCNKETDSLDDVIECGVVKEQENFKYSANRFSKKRRSLKRSLSETALDDIRDDSNHENENNSFLRPKRKKKRLDYSDETQLFAENICHVLQNHRRNSMSSMHNEENVSFCILIDNNCIITEECADSDKICFSEVPESCIACVQENSLNDAEESEVIQFQDDVDYQYSTPMNDSFEEKSLDEPWVEDVACVETVVSDDIAEDIILSAPTTPRDSESESDQSDNETYENEHTDKLKYIYGEKMQSEDARFVDTLYRTPQMNVNQTLCNRESQIIEDCGRCYDNESLERILSNSFTHEETTNNQIDFECTSPLPVSSPESETPDDSSSSIENTGLLNSITYNAELPVILNYKQERIHSPFQNQTCDDKEDCAVVLKSDLKINAISSCESSIDDILSSKINDESSKCTISSSPEVSSTTSEEKNSGILLKITNYSGSRVSQVNNVIPITSISCKYTEKKEYLSSSNKQYLNPNLSARTLITKAAQKYIPPLKETIPDLKVKLPLPPHSLMKLREMKIAKGMPKLNEDKTNTRKEGPKKAKPKFEDVLKSIDEIQYQMHKDKNKRGRKSIPKVVIKKNENGSHYASTSSRNNKYNPDLTGRKWQPWVFLEKNNFIDKMALKKKSRAIFSHRKKAYVFAEKFQKYKSVNSTKFVISQPKFEDSPSGNLKYTIRLKHHY